MAQDVFLVLGAVGAIAAVLLLRISWAQPRRSVSLNATAWFFLAVSLASGWTFAGAWGVTILSLWAMGAAFVALGFAAWKSPPARRKPSNRRAGMLPEAGEPLRLGGRCATFLLVLLAGMIAAIALGITTRWISQLSGASDADANVLALFVVPLGWTVLTFLILMTGSRKRQLAIIAAAVATALPALATGSLL
jgi:hypothetical protein